MNDIIRHSGKVIDIKEDTATVSFPRSSACSTCHAKGACISADTQDMQVEVNKSNKDVKIGQNVNIIIYRNMGLKAVFICYFFPLILMLSAMIFISNIYENDLYAGAGAILILFPYYILLYLLKGKFEKKFKAHIE